jgi:DNA recombination protein RmuC
MIALSLSLAAALVAALFVFRAREKALAADLAASHAEVRALIEKNARDALAARDEMAKELNAAREIANLELSNERSRIGSLIAEAAALRTRLDEFANQKQLLDEAQKKIEAIILQSSKTAFDTNVAHAVRIAEQAFKQQQETGQQAVAQMVKPVAEQLTKVNEQIGLFEKSAAVQNARVSEQMRAVALNTDKLHQGVSQLATALRAPATRGRWGETQLRRTLELAGLKEHIDFDEQPVATVPDGVLRPDVAVHLPGGKTVLLDSKVPLEAFQRAVDASPDERAELLKTHAQQLRAHVESLSRKQYWGAFADSPEMTVLFLPADGLLSAALEADPLLTEDAFAKRIVLATPATLLALLLTIAHVWKQESIAENARQIANEGRELHKRLASVSEHLAKLGRALESSLRAYNQAVGSFDTRVVPAARRFEKLEAAAADVRLEPLLEIELVPRLPRAVAEDPQVDDAN